MSRTLNGIKNFKYSFLFFIVILALNFISRKVFINELGINLVGLNTTIYNLISFLNVAELGIGVSVSYVLYKYLIEKNDIAISEIISLLGKYYRIIGTVIFIISFGLLFLLPTIFKKSELPIYYPYVAFVTLTFSVIISYFYNFKQIILLADQKNYVVTTITNLSKILKVLLQLVFLIYLDFYKYEIWLLIEVIFSIICIYVTNYYVKKNYPNLQIDLNKAKLYKAKYPDVLRKTKQLFFHKLSAFILTQTSPLILLAFASLSIVGLYSNYQLIIMGFTALISTIFSGIVASVGNLINDKNQNVMKVYWEILLVEFILVSSVCFIFYFYANSFIYIWLGSDFLLDSLSFKLLTLYLFFNTVRQSDIFISAYGLFGDIFAPIIEIILNLVGSIVLGKFFGLPGILIGVNFSLFIIVFLWKPFYLFKKGFKVSYSNYLFKMLSLILISILITFIIIKINFLNIRFNNTYIDLVVSIIINYGLFILMQLLIYYFFFKEFKNLLSRIKIIKK